MKVAFFLFLLIHTPLLCKESLSERVAPIASASKTHPAASIRFDLLPEAGDIDPLELEMFETPPQIWPIGGGTGKISEKARRRARKRAARKARKEAQKSKDSFSGEYQTDIDSAKAASEDCVKSKLEKYDPRGKMLAYYDMGYDQYNQMTDKYYYGPKGQLLMYSSFSYSDFGKILGQYIYDHSGKLQSAVDYVYENGLLVKQTLLDKYGEVKRAIHFVYDEAGKKVAEFVENAKGKLLYYTKYFYDARDKLVSWAKYNRLGQLASTSYAYYQTAKEYLQAQRDRIRQFHDEQKAKIYAFKDYVRQKFDEYTKRLLIEVYSSTGLLMEYTQNKYDEYNNLVSQYAHDQSGKVTGYALAKFDCGE